MTALVLTTTTFTLEKKKMFGFFFTATNELLLGLVDEKLTSFQYPLAFFLHQFLITEVRLYGK